MGHAPMSLHVHQLPKRDGAASVFANVTLKGCHAGLDPASTAARSGTLSTPLWIPDQVRDDMTQWDTTQWDRTQWDTPQ